MEAVASDLVSVVIPVYNAERYIEETLASVLAQTYPQVEIIAVDDGSGDRSVEILRRYGERVRVFTQQNAGAAAARNRGVQEARGKWIAFLDADDLWVPDKLEKQLALKDRFQWSYADCEFMGGVNDGCRDSDFTEKHQGWVIDKLVCGNFIGTSSLVIARDVFLEFGGFCEAMSNIEDWELWLRIAPHYEIGFIDEVLCRYRIHPTSVSRNTRNTLPSHLKVINWAFGDDGPARQWPELKSKAVSQSYSVCSGIAEEEGDLTFALRCAISACRFQPGEIQLWVRSIKAAIKWCLAGVGVRFSMHAWWVGAIFVIEPALRS